MTLNGVGGFLDKLNEASGCDISTANIQIVLVTTRITCHQAVTGYLQRRSGNTQPEPAPLQGLVMAMMRVTPS